jgi:hypothetical protein
MSAFYVARVICLRRYLQQRLNLFFKSTEVALSTVVDSLDEAREELVQQQQSQTQGAHEEKRTSMRIVSGGVGSVTMKDVTTTIAANGNVRSFLSYRPVYLYNFVFSCPILIRSSFFLDAICRAYFDSHFSDIQCGL